MVTVINWQGDVKGMMYSNGITGEMLADKLGLTQGYVAQVFTGKRTPAGAEERFRRAVAEIIAERNEKNDS